MTLRQYAVALVGEADRLTRPIRAVVRPTTSTIITQRATATRRHARPVAMTVEHRTAMGMLWAAVVWCLANLVFWGGLAGIGPVLHGLGV